MAIAAMFVGALVGSLLIFHAAIIAPLVIALIILAVIAATTRQLSRNDPHWVRAS
jgi:hypothetical protein